MIGLKESALINEAIRHLGLKQKIKEYIKENLYVHPN
jgi:hypothetical protein